MDYNKRLLITLLDRPGGRYLLGRMASRFARKATDKDVEVLYANGLWAHRVGRVYFPDSPQFPYTSKDFDRWMGQEARYISEAEDFWFHSYRPREGDVIVDIGAGRGEDVLSFSRGVGRSGRVIAIEAQPVSFSILRNFCRLNKLVNAVPLHLAVMDTPGRVRISEELTWIENKVSTSVDSKGVEVPADSFDNICEKQRIHDIAFLKMNIEGAERYALSGMRSALHSVKQLCIACHDFRADWGHGEEFRTRAFVEEFLVEQGFSVSSRPEDPRDYVRDHVFGIRP